MDRLIAVLMGVAAVIHLLPLTGALGGERLERLYGQRFEDPDTAVLMRHRAVLFGLLGLLLLAGALLPALRAAALVGGGTSAVAFLVIASAGRAGPALRKVVVADVVATLCLAAAGVLHVSAVATRPSPADLSTAAYGARTPAVASPGECWRDPDAPPVHPLGIRTSCATDPARLGDRIQEVALRWADPAAYEPFDLAGALGAVLRDQCTDVVGFGVAQIPNTSNYVGVYRCNHPFRQDAPWCVEAGAPDLPGQGLIAWITHHPAGAAGPGDIGLLREDEEGQPVIGPDDFFYADGYDRTWPPAAEWYLDAVQRGEDSGAWSPYGEAGFPCGPLPPQRTWVRPILRGGVRWGAVYISLTR